MKGSILFHKGVDLAAPSGQPVYASGNGKVTAAGYSRSYGNFVRIRHAGGYETLYAHLERIRAWQGETVHIGRHIGDVGNTGLATGSHLHFELIQDGRPLDPLAWFGRRDK